MLNLEIKFFNLLTLTFMIFISQIKCDDEAKKPSPTFAPTWPKENATCFFFFVFEGLDLTSARRCFPSAIYISIPHLPKHRVDFLPSSNPDLMYVTAVPDEENDIWGNVYIVRNQEYNNYAQIDNYHEGTLAGHSVAQKIKIETNGQHYKIDCNLLVAIHQPAKENILPKDRRPSRKVKEGILQEFKQSGFPQYYIDKVAQIPTADG